MGSFAAEPKKLILVYDPLCGWCYGATPGVRRLAAHASVDMVPAGLFAGTGARPMDDAFAQHAWENDQRIAKLSGQPFSARYRERVLAVRGGMLDSEPATIALTAARQVGPQHELPALEAIQKARYVEGRDVTDYAVLAMVLSSLELADAADRLRNDPAGLEKAAHARMREGQQLLRSVGAQGVPTLIDLTGPRPRAVPSELLYAPS